MRLDFKAKNIAILIFHVCYIKNSVSSPVISKEKMPLLSHIINKLKLKPIS